jgi:hypothetical protein
LAGPARDDAILARWTLDEAAWDAFVLAVDANRPGSRLELRDATVAGRTVVVASDAIHVGRERIDLAHFHVHRVVEHGGWLQLLELDPDYLPCPLPLPTGDARLAAWALGHFRAIAARNAREWEQLSRQAEVERNRPTFANGVRRFAERHFIAWLLVFFFVVLPLGAVLAGWIAGE